MVLINQLLYFVNVKTMRNFFSNYVCFSKSLNFKKLGYDFKKICSLLEYNNFKKIVLICNAFWIFLLVSFSLVFQNLKLQKLLHFLRISLESDSAFLRDVFNNPRNKGQIGGIFLFLFKHLSWSTNVLGTINHFQILAT